MSELQATLAPLSRDELLILCSDLAVRLAIRLDELDRMVLAARWQAASAVVLTAQRAADEAWQEWTSLCCGQASRLTSALLAEREAAERRRNRLDAIAKRAVRVERDLWDRLSATWAPAVEAEP